MELFSELLNRSNNEFLEIGFWGAPNLFCPLQWLWATAFLQIP